jgi:AraC-like DNA-binding protein
MPPSWRPGAGLSIGRDDLEWYATRMHRLPLSTPPRLVDCYRQSLHGTRGDESYHMDGFWCLNLFHDAAVLELSGQHHAIPAGSAVITPADIDHTYRFPAPTRQTWYHFMPQPKAAPADLPVVTPLADRWPAFLAAALDGIAAEPARRQARLWDLLWSLASEPAESSGPPPLTRTLLAWIDEHLAEPIGPADAARALRLSTSQVGRLCVAATGRPLLAEIRHRRAARAVHLLRSTGLRASQVGALVGWPDPQHFNKLLRRLTGKAPGAWRRG